MPLDGATFKVYPKLYLLKLAVKNKKAALLSELLKVN